MAAVFLIAEIFVVAELFGDIEPVMTAFSGTELHKKSNRIR